MEEWFKPLIGTAIGSLITALLFIVRFNGKFSVMEERGIDDRKARIEVTGQLTTLLTNVAIMGVEMHALGVQVTTLLMQQSLHSNELNALKTKVDVMESKVDDFRHNLHVLNNFVMGDNSKRYETGERNGGGEI